jgi:Ca2+-binding RTX toxin-like protein
MKRFVSLSAVLVGVLVGAYAPTTASTQATRFCEGHEATIVGTSGDDSIEQGLDGDDVYVMLGGYDYVVAGHGNDVVCGNGAHDNLRGKNGDDILRGGGDNDVLTGMSGSDVVYGGAGDDYLLGDRGSDISHGGPGNDRLVDLHGRDTLLGRWARDELTARDGDPDDVIDGGRGFDRCLGDEGDTILRCETDQFPEE